MSQTPDNLIDLTKELIDLRKRPGTEERFKSYPMMLQRFDELLAACDDPQVLAEVINLDSGYFLLAGYRQRVIETLLTIQRTPQIIRLYAMQLELFGNVDQYGEANLEVEEQVTALYQEADHLEST